MTRPKLFRLIAPVLIAPLLVASLLAAKVAHAADNPVPVAPQYAALRPGETLQLAAPVAGGGAVLWQVDGVIGGSATTGTISPTGLYTAPATTPPLRSATITALSASDPGLFGTTSVTLTDAQATGVIRYVATNGNDIGPGTAAAPWRTIQHAANLANAGDTIYVRGGTYNEVVTVARSGSAAAGFITLSTYPDEQAIIDGTGLKVPNGMWGLVTLANPKKPFAVDYVVVNGFELRNFSTTALSQVPIGIFIQGVGTNIQIVNNHIHDIVTNAHTNPNKCGSDAFGMTVYGTSKTGSISGLVIAGNEIDHLKTGCSESLSVDGNVEDFLIAGNRVHDNDNIAIGAIGFEHVAPKGFDQARGGVIRGNVVYNITSFGNPDYGAQYAADGIYVDGGTDIIVEQNLIHDVDIGIELASEHHLKTTSNVIARNNVIYHGNTSGISIGGYANGVGGTDRCTIVNNTLVGNGVVNIGQNTASGEFQIQYHATNNLFANNIVVANPLSGTNQALFLNNFTPTPPAPAAVDHNLYFSSVGAMNGLWVWQKKTYTGFQAYLAGTGNDIHSLPFLDPLFVGSAFDVSTTSPAVNAGMDFGPDLMGTTDFMGRPRVQAGRVTLGAFQQ